MSSIEYAELAGLEIAAKNLALIPIEFQDQAYIHTLEWLRSRIQELKQKVKH